ncbi:MAG TPA: putative sulfate exporter family transporter, partial [Rhodospirillales bacterium]|nr:putative sulfate exporter family transporter [Rhodospirillales bacterium]
MNAIWGFLLALFLALTGEYLAGVLAPALGLQKGAISGIMMAILLGILVNNLFKLPEFLRPGIKFSVVRILRLGIVLLGIRLSIVEAGAIGLKALPVIIGTILAAIAIVTYVSRRVGLTDRLGTLIAVGTSICGATAIVAMSPTIGARDDETSYAVACITLFGVAA